jgi:uncharacterized protein YbbC (DUF1343 family)
VLHDSSAVQLTTLFSPEHGMAGKLDTAHIDDGIDRATGLKIYSLYGSTRRPTQEMLKDVDTIVFDIQDIGARFYTYISTMGEAMQAAVDHGKRFVVLDRPNPINGLDVAGPMLDVGKESFVGFHRLPVRHGMTIGELALMFQHERFPKLQLEVIPCKGWNRSMFWDATGLMWVNPSPNMRCLTQALLYPGIGILETTNISVGRGTDTPFEFIGAPWIQPRTLSAALNSRQIPGVAFIPVTLTPNSSKYADQPCGGLNIVVTNRSEFEPLIVGLEIATQLQAHYPGDWTAKEAMTLLGNEQTMNAIISGQTASDVQKVADLGVDDFLARRKAFLLYP